MWLGVDSFETSGSLDGWTTGSMDRPFVQRSGTTPSSGTGPQGAADGSYYLFAEISGQYGMTFDLQKTIVGGAILLSLIHI